MHPYSRLSPTIRTNLLKSLVGSTVTDIYHAVYHFQDTEKNYSIGDTVPILLLEVNSSMLIQFSAYRVRYIEIKEHDYYYDMRRYKFMQDKPFPYDRYEERLGVKLVLNKVNAKNIAHSPLSKRIIDVLLIIETDKLLKRIGQRRSRTHKVRGIRLLLENNLTLDLMSGFFDEESFFQIKEGGDLNPMYGIMYKEDEFTIAEIDEHVDQFPSLLGRSEDKYRNILEQAGISFEKISSPKLGKGQLVIDPFMLVTRLSILENFLRASPGIKDKLFTLKEIILREKFGLAELKLLVSVNGEVKILEPVDFTLPLDENKTFLVALIALYD